MALELGELSVEELAKTIPCNEKIALENKLRYQDFFNEEAYLPALLAYYGQAYKCLKAQEYSQEDFSYADKHLWITSPSALKEKPNFLRLKARICLLIGSLSSQISSLKL